MSDDHDAYMRQAAGSGEGGTSRGRQKGMAVLFGCGLAFAGFSAAGMEMQHNYTDPGVIVAAAIVLGVALFAGK